MQIFIQKFLRFLLNNYPFYIGHDQIFQRIDKFSFCEKEDLLYVKSIGCELYLDPRTYLSRHLYYFGIYEPLIVKFLN